MAIDYFTKWVEVVPIEKATTRVVVDYLMSNILTRFGCTKRIVSDNSMCFRSEEYT